MKNAKLHETTEAAAEAGPLTEPCGPRLTSRELASLYCLSREKMEDELVRFGLRDPNHDGSTLYPVAEVARRLDEEDHAKVTAAAALTDRFSSDSLVRQAVQEAFIELRGKWLSDSGLFDEVAALKRGIAAKLAKTNSLQRARRAGDAWEELEAIENFEHGLLGAIRERRRKERQVNDVG